MSIRTARVSYRMSGYGNVENCAIGFSSGLDSISEEWDTIFEKEFREIRRKNMHIRRDMKEVRENIALLQSKKSTIMAGRKWFDRVRNIIPASVYEIETEMEIQSDKLYKLEQEYKEAQRLYMKAESYHDGNRLDEIVSFLISKGFIFVCTASGDNGYCIQMWYKEVSNEG